MSIISAPEVGQQVVQQTGKDAPAQRALLCAALLAAGRPLSEKELLKLLLASETVANANTSNSHPADVENSAASVDKEKVDEANDEINTVPDLRALLRDLEQTLSSNNLGLKVEEVAGGFRLVVAPHLTPALAALLSPPPLPNLSNAALETLALIAYKQPITRGELEACRGSSCSSTLDTLQERELIRVTGQKDAIGKPLLYGTTQKFLLEFGLNSLSDLPPLEDAPTDFVRS